MGYWDETDRIIAENGGKNPICPVCKTEMYPVDDHGRFACRCQPFGPGPILSIPQVPGDAVLTDKEKEKIPAINRLHLSPTKREVEELSRLNEMFKDIGIQTTEGSS